jgi:hypothetical protein
MWLLTFINDLNFGKSKSFLGALSGCSKISFPEKPSEEVN